VKVEDFLQRLKHVRNNGKGWTALCPAHDDHNPSLSINVTEDATVLLKCHRGCAIEAVLAALGLAVSDLFPPRQASGRPKGDSSRMVSKKPKVYATLEVALTAVEEQVKGRHIATWIYLRPDGTQHFCVARFNLPGAEPDEKSKKVFRPLHSTGHGWVIGDPPGPLSLYRLAELTGAPRVFVLEGEKATEAARSLGLVATTSAHGADSAKKTDWSPLRGREVIFLPDRDSAGKEYVHSVVALLSRLRPMPRVRIVELPDLPESGDIVEFIAQRKAGGMSPEDVRTEIEALVDQSPPIDIESNAMTPTPAVPFPLKELPEPLSTFVAQGAASMRCDPSFIALPLFAALASAIGNTRRIRLKRGWAEPSILWTTIVGTSGTLKSPALDLALRSIRKRQAETLRLYEAQLKSYEEALIQYQKNLAQWDSKSKHDCPEKPEKPVAPQMLVSDITVESLALLLKDAPRGLLLARDELSGWLGSFNQYKKGNADAAHWLEMHRAGFLKVDRKTGAVNHIFVPHAAVSIAGGIQPGTLARALTREFFENGLAARLLLAMPERPKREWTEDEVSADLELAVENIFEKLWSLELQHDENGEPQPVDLPLAPEAKKEWVDFYNAHADEQATLSEDLAAAWSKLEGYAARLALIIQLVRWASGDPKARFDAVDRESVIAGIALTRWFCQGATEERRETMDLLQLIRRRGSRITARDLQRSGRFEIADDAEAALEKLVEEGWGDWEDIPPGPKGGRASRVFVLTEHALENESDADASDITDTSPSSTHEVPSDSSVVSPVRKVEEEGEWTQ
jgi:hypothetical protein